MRRRVDVTLSEEERGVLERWARRPGKPRQISDEDIERVIVKTLEEKAIQRNALVDLPADQRLRSPAGAFRLGIRMIQGPTCLYDGGRAPIAQSDRAIPS